MSLRALLWDLDGTLLDTEEVWLTAETEVMAAHGYRWSDADQRHCLGGPLERVAQYMSTLTADSTSAHQIADELLEAMEGYLRDHEAAWQPGVVTLIEGALAEGLSLALVTASHRRLLEALDATLEDGLAQAVSAQPPVFAVTVAGDEVAQTKPHPDPYLKAANLLGVDIDECVVFEDSPTGVQSGLASGALVIAIPHVAPIEDSARCRVVPSLEALDVATVRAWHAQAR
jgi:beta-phosphoglucomutase-like phosphatase (HAD superfamily)